jgi:hypothetical protein
MRHFLNRQGFHTYTQLLPSGKTVVLESCHYRRKTGKTNARRVSLTPFREQSFRWFDSHAANGCMKRFSLLATK